MEGGVTSSSSDFSLATRKDNIGLYILQAFVREITASNVIGTYLKRIIVWSINTKKLFLRKNDKKTPFLTMKISKLEMLNFY